MEVEVAKDTSTKTVDFTPPSVIRLCWTDGNASERILLSSTVRYHCVWTCTVLFLSFNIR